MSSASAWHWERSERRTADGVSLDLVQRRAGIVAGVVLSLAMKRVVAQWAQGSSISFAVLLGVTVLLALWRRLHACCRRIAHRLSIPCRRCGMSSY